jgi:hypothetical protein
MSLTTAIINEGPGRYSTTAFTDQTAAGNGAWLDISTIASWSVHVTDIVAGDIVTVSVSNAATIPSDAADEITHSTVSADGIVAEAANVYKWLKVHKSDGSGAGSTDAVIFFTR